MSESMRICSIAILDPMGLLVGYRETPENEMLPGDVEVPDQALAPRQHRWDFMHQRFLPDDGSAFPFQLAEAFAEGFRHLFYNMEMPPTLQRWVVWMEEQAMMRKLRDEASAKQV